MSFREFFIVSTWWGKIIGAFFGYLIDGPIGAIFGLLVGNFLIVVYILIFLILIGYITLKNVKQSKKPFLKLPFPLWGI